MTLIAYALWMLCWFAAVVFITFAKDRRLAVACWVLGFAGAAGWSQPDRPPDAAMIGCGVAILSGLQLLRPHLVVWTAGCGGILAGLSIWFLQVLGLPKVPAMMLAAMLPILAFYLSVTRPIFAPAALREEALLVVLVIGVAVAVVPGISAGWHSALSLNLEENRTGSSVLPSWVLFGSGTSGMLGGLYSFWRHR